MVLLWQPEKRNQLEDLKGNINLGWGSVDWIHLGSDRDKWRDVVNTTVTLQVA
jgi:hypothetical protein